MHPASSRERRPCRVCGGRDTDPIFFLDDVEIVRCRACGFVQIAQVFSLEEIKEYYRSKDEGQVPPHAAALMARRLRRASRFRARVLQRYTGLTSGHVLEVGSSQGHFLAVLKERGFQVLGVEPTPVGAEKHREQGIPVINDILENASLPLDHFDAVCLFQVFEHLEDPRSMSELIHAILKPGGYLLVEVPDIFSVGAKFEKTPHKLFNREHLNYFSFQTLNRLLMQVGFLPVAARHYDYDGLFSPFGKSLKKIVLPLLNPGLEGPLDRILRGDIPRRHRTPAPPPRANGPGMKKSPRFRLKAFGKALSAPLNLALGYVAMKLHRGASLCWIGRKGA